MTPSRPPRGVHGSGPVLTVPPGYRSVHVTCPPIEGGAAFVPLPGVGSTSLADPDPWACTTVDLPEAAGAEASWAACEAGSVRACGSVCGWGCVAGAGA